jgi:hypothetical protein
MSRPYGETDHTPPTESAQPNAREPYYSDDLVTIFHGDCRDLLPSIEADVIVTDPPYGIGSVWKGGRGHGWAKADADKIVRNVWDSETPMEGDAKAHPRRSGPPWSASESAAIRPTIASRTGRSLYFGRIVFT